MNIKTFPSTVIEEFPHISVSKSWRTYLIGKPLATADAAHQTIGKLVGLAVFSSDALSSVAYGPQEMMLILSVAGMAALPYAFPVAIGIGVLLLILTFSYEQTIHAYPGGGGAYIVARDNLGELPAQTAGAALLTDYVLTVAVSISSGVAQLVSAFPALFTYRVWIGVGLVLFVMLINLRGVRESGATFALPTYFFLVLMFVTVLIGFFRLFTGTLGMVVDPPEMIVNVIQPMSFLIILRAFSNGTTSLTGVEAISNGITAFKKPNSVNAGKTLIWMSGILGTLLLGITYLSVHIQALPAESETVISQLTRTVFDGRGVLYLMTISATTVILIMAANTAFADFPRLGALHAGDGFLPRQMTSRGSRLVFSRGIVTLAVISSALIILFQASVTRLIPLYAIGVFLSFTLSQTGMARRWWKSGHLEPGVEVKEPGSILKHDRQWIFKMVVNGFGALCTFVVMVVFAITKFRSGAWIVVILTPLLVTIFFTIHHHYKSLARQLSLDNGGGRGSAKLKRCRVFILVGGVHQGTLAALRFAGQLSDDVTAVHVSTDPDETEKIRNKWDKWGSGFRLVILDSPFRLFLEPFLAYLSKIEAVTEPNDLITIVVPQFVPRQWWANFLHKRTAQTLRKSLLFREEIVIVEVPYQIK